MAFEFKLPDLGEGLTEGEIVKWLVKEGDSIDEGQVFVQVETDKAVIEIPSPRKGVVLKIGAAEGETVQVGTVILVIGEPGEKPGEKPGEAAPPKEEAKQRPSVGVVGELEEAPEEEEVRKEERKAPPPEAGPPQPGPILAVPMVRKLAADMHVDLRRVRGSGPHGRITKEDVLKAAEPGKPAEPPSRKAAEKQPPPTPTEKGRIPGRKYDFYGFIERVPLRGLRKTISREMVKSASTIPRAVNMDDADITHLADLKTRAKDMAKQRGIHLTYLPFIMKAVVAALEEHPYVNASMDDETGEIVLKKYYNIGLAVDTKDGLMVPVIKNVPGKNIFQLAAELADISEKARARTIDLADLKGGTFTITNYGIFGSLFGTPVINQPQSAIMGTGTIQKRVIVIDDAIAIRPMIYLSITIDHRLLDGATGDQFMQKVRRFLEEYPAH